MRPARRRNVRLNEPTRADNSRHVVTAVNPSGTIRFALDGLTITGGNHTGYEIGDYGGAGLFAQRVVSLDLRRVTFRWNCGVGRGGAMVVDNLPAYSAGCRVCGTWLTVDGNFGGAGAGGLHVSFCQNVDISHGDFEGNATNSMGGAIDVLAGNLWLSNSKVHLSWAGHNGPATARP